MDYRYNVKWDCTRSGLRHKESLYNFGLGRDEALSMTYKTLVDLEFIKIKGDCTWRDIFKKMEIQAKWWGGKSHVMYGLIRDMYPKYVKNSYNKIRKRPNLKWAKDLNNYFTKNIYKWLVNN